ncbi:hypothetical protein K8T06_17850, partial [bacterium]|nr:hypothetical protein [bacterium]
SSFESNDSGLTWKPSSLDCRFKGVLRIRESDPEQIINHKNITKDGGLTWSRLGCVSSLIEFMNGNMVISKHSMNIAKMDNQGPVIQVSGFADTQLKVGTSSYLNYMAYVVDPSENDVIDHLEMYCFDEPIGFQIDAQGVEHNELIQWSILLTPTAPFFGNIQFRGIDSFGNLGPISHTFNSR